MSDPDSSAGTKPVNELMQAWNRRLRNPVADYIIIWLAAYSSEPAYPYSIHAKLVELWNDEDAPALQSIYSAIRRLEKDGILESDQVIVEGRVQKTLKTTPLGFDLLDHMKTSFEELNRSLERYHNFEVGS